MKNMLKNKKMLAIIGGVIIVLAIIIICIVLNVNKKEDTPTSKEETHTMFVKINPLVKLTFKEEYNLCKNEKGKDTICGGVGTEVIGYELLNDDAKDIYDNLNFNGKEIEDVLLMLCDTARDNKIGFKSLEITSDSNNLDRDKIFKYLQDNSKYEDEFEIYINFEEHIDEEKILEKENDIEKETYTIKFDSDGGTEIENQTIELNEKIKEPANPTKNGYKFVEWQLDGNKFDFNTEITKDITLKAKWEKDDTNNNNQGNTQPDNNKPSNNNNNNNSSNDNSQSKTPEENEPKITSTLSKINLNENIMIEIYYPGTACGWIYYPTNLEEIFPEYVDSKSLYLDDGSYGLDSNIYYSKQDQIEYDTTKENITDNKLKTLINKKTPGIANFSYSFNEHKFKYFYNEIKIVDENTFKALKDDLYKAQDIFGDTFKDSYFVIGACGTGPDNPTLLTEELCNKFNLTCDRW